MPRGYACAVALILTGAIYLLTRIAHRHRTGRWF